jgi:enamine deaminase RidA (YjgF/YER057c/UK114 family)
MSIERLNVGKRLSDCVILTPAAGTKLVFLAGQVADEPQADITGQTQQVLAQIDDLLFEAGSDKSKILSATIYLPDMNDFAAMNAVWEQWVAPAQTPARATVQAKLAAPHYRIEIQIVAAAPASQPR